MSAAGACWAESGSSPPAETPEHEPAAPASDPEAPAPPHNGPSAAQRAALLELALFRLNGIGLTRPARRVGRR